MALFKKKTKEEKIVLKERERVHKEMLKKADVLRKEDKIAPEGAFVSLQHINKIYPNHVQAVYAFNLDIMSTRGTALSSVSASVSSRSFFRNIGAVRGSTCSSL